MNQPVVIPPVPFEQGVPQIVDCAIQRLEQDGIRQGFTPKQIHSLIVDHLVSVLEKKGWGVSP